MTRTEYVLLSWLGLLKFFHVSCLVVWYELSVQVDWSGYLYICNNIDAVKHVMYCVIVSKNESSLVAIYNICNLVNSHCGSSKTLNTTPLTRVYKN